jgi:hypothetical protein
LIIKSFLDVQHSGRLWESLWLDLSISQNLRDFSFLYIVINYGHSQCVQVGNRMVIFLFMIIRNIFCSSLGSWKQCRTIFWGKREGMTKNAHMKKWVLNKEGILNQVWWCNITIIFILSFTV